MRVAKTIRAIREQKGFSQEGFAQRAAIDRSRYGRIERGEINISLNTLFDIAFALEVEPAELLGSVTRAFLSKAGARWEN